MAAVICGTGSYAPGYVMDNDKIAELVETNDTWIRERTGIRQRHIAKTETTTYMAAEAAGRAIENAGISPEAMVTWLGTQAQVWVLDRVCRGGRESSAGFFPRAHIAGI